MPYAYDLVRLLASARLAPTLAVNRREAAAALVEGYRNGLEQPRPMLLDEHEHWLRRLVGGAANASQKFWQEVDRYPDAKPPGPVRRALRRGLPSGARIERYASRVKGSGSLGRPRYLVIALWQGGRLVQEAKALVPSAWHWAHPDSSAKSRVLDLAFGPHRSLILTFESWPATYCAESPLMRTKSNWQMCTGKVCAKSFLRRWDPSWARFTPRATAHQSLRICERATQGGWIAPPLMRRRPYVVTSRTSGSECARGGFACWR